MAKEQVITVPVAKSDCGCGCNGGCGSGAAREQGLPTR